VLGGRLADLDVEYGRRANFLEPGILSEHLDGHDGGSVQSLGWDLRSVTNLPVVGVADRAGPDRHGQKISDSSFVRQSRARLFCAEEKIHRPQRRKSLLNNNVLEPQPHGCMLGPPAFLSTAAPRRAAPAPSLSLINPSNSHCGGCLTNSRQRGQAGEDLTHVCPRQHRTRPSTHRNMECT
jgi:hypothetical protein